MNEMDEWTNEMNYRMKKRRNPHEKKKPQRKIVRKQKVAVTSNGRKLDIFN